MMHYVTFSFIKKDVPHEKWRGYNKTGDFSLKKEKSKLTG